MNRAFKYLAGGFLFLLPFFVVASPIEWNQIDPPKFLALFLLGNIAFSAFLFKKFGHLVAASHLLLCFCATITGFTSMQILPYAYWVASWFIALYFVDLNDKDKIFFTRFLLYAIVIQAALAVLQIFKIDPIFNYAPGVAGHPIGFFGQESKFGCLTACLAAIALGLEEFVIFFILAAITITTASSFVLLSLIAGTLTVLRYSIGRWLTAAIIISGILAGVAWYSINPKSQVFIYHQRPETYADVYYAWTEGSLCKEFSATTDKFQNGAPRMVCRERYSRSPLIFWLGYGPGSFYELFYDHFQRDATKHYGEFRQAHCDYIQILFEYGLIGGLALSCFLFVVLKYYYRSWFLYPEATHRLYVRKSKIFIAAEAGLAALMIDAIGGFPFHLAPHLMIGIVCLAILFKKD